VRALPRLSHKPLVRAPPPGFAERLRRTSPTTAKKSNFKASTVEYDVVVLDIMLPKLDGRTCCSPVCGSPAVEDARPHLTPPNHSATRWPGLPGRPGP